MAETVPTFRGIEHVPPCAQLFSDLKTFLIYAEHKEEYTANFYEQRRKRMVKEKLERLEIRTPEPNPRHTCCNVCHVTYRDGEYKEHIRGERHALNVAASSNLYNQIDDIIGQLDTKLEAKEEAALEETRLNSRLQKGRNHNESSLDCEDSFSLQFNPLFAFNNSL